ncbi:MAG: glycogen debranching enzyme GlgX, partial [Jatrophihabitantaceae bacterium]
YRTQGGNNNAYVQDNEVSWLDWEDTPASADLLQLTRRLIALRRASPVLRQRAFFQGRAIDSDGRKDLAWFHPSGHELDDRDWFDRGLRTIGMYLDGRGLRHRGRRGEIIRDHSYLLLLHSGEQPVRFALPGLPWADRYQVVIDTAEEGGCSPTEPVDGGAEVTVTGRSVLLLRADRD